MIRYLLLPFAALLLPLGQNPLTVRSDLMTDPQDKPKVVEPAGPEVGKPAPSFRLNDHEGHAVAIGGETDRWTVLAFYPRAATPG